MIGKKRGKNFLLYGHRLRFIIAASIASIIVLMIIALGSYANHDESFIIQKSSARSASNLLGVVGAYSASFVWYLFGISGIAIIASLSYALWFVLRNKSWDEECDRIIGYVLLPLSLSVGASAYEYDLIYEVAPGGLVGQWICDFLSPLFDSFVIKIIASSMIIASFLLIGRSLVPHIMHSFYYVGCFLTSRTYLWSPLYRIISFCLSLVYRACAGIAHYCYDVLSGTMAERVELERIRKFEEAWRVAQREQNEQFFTGSDSVSEMAPGADNQIMPAVSVDIPVISVDKVADSQMHDAVTSPSYSLPEIMIKIGVKEERGDKKITRELEQRALTLKEKLERFGVYGEVVAIRRGPVVTVFEYQPNIDSKLSKIIALEDDLALALQALSIRIIAPIPGTAVVGFEVANSVRSSVSFAHIVASREFKKFKGMLPLVLGENTIGQQVIVDLARMPHLLIAGSTGSGKSVALNGMLVSLLCALPPEHMRIILIDPKRLEFAPYADIAHLLFPIIVDPKKVAPVLRYVVEEMEQRYEAMAKIGARNIFDYYELSGDRTSMPLLVVVIDELADLMMTAGRDIEDLIARIAQMARAAGIHMMIATQRPSVDVITGLIKVNFPSRISFRVTSKVDSRTILDCTGADKLLGRGDMLFLDSSSASLNRVHGAYVSDQEITAVVAHIKKQRIVSYKELPDDGMFHDDNGSEEDAQLYQEIISFLDTIDEISISLLQRRFRIGYNRSARIIDTLEARGLVLPNQGGKMRKVLHQR